MTENEILDFINEAVEEENGQEVTIDDTLADMKLDSFGYAMLLCALDDEYGNFSPKEMKGGGTLDGDTTVRSLVEKIQHEAK